MWLSTPMFGLGSAAIFLSNNIEVDPAARVILSKAKTCC